MNKHLVGGLALGLGLANVAVAQESEDALKGLPVTIAGCVVTNKENSFVLTQVEEISGPTSSAQSATLDGMDGVKGASPGVIYWLSEDSVKMMRGHLGHRVEVTGKITDVSSGTLTVKQDPGKDGPDNSVKVEARNKEATAKTDLPVTSGPPAAVKTEDKKNLPVRRVQVDTVKMVSPNCR